MPTNWNTTYQQNPYMEHLPHPGVVRFSADVKQRGARQVLDLGCGDGRHLIYLARQGFLLTGVDNALWGLRRAGEWLDKEGLTARLACADVRCLPFSNVHFDSVISIQVIHHQLISGIRETLLEVKRVLRLGGCFYFTVPAYPPGNWKGNQYNQIEEHTYAPLEGFEKGLPHHFFTQAELALVLNNFEILEIKADSQRHLSALVRKAL